MPRISDDVVVGGDGPAGLQCSLLLAKNGLGVRLLGVDGTPTNKAVLYNYLGADGVSGPNFMELARQYAEGHGVHLQRQSAARAGRAVVTDGGNVFDGRYLVLCTGKDRALAEQLGLPIGDDGVQVDRW